MNKINDLFKGEVKVINMGLTAFYNDLKDQKVAVIQMAWQPPAGGNQRMLALLEKLE